MKYTDKEMLEFDPFGDAEGITHRKANIVKKTRKLHWCCWCQTGNPHEIPTGSKAWHEKALVDNVWRSCYICIECFEKILDEINSRWYQGI